MLAVQWRTRCRRGALTGFIYGLTFFLVLLSWMTVIGMDAWILLAAYCALWNAALGALVAPLSRLARFGAMGAVGLGGHGSTQRPRPFGWLSVRGRDRVLARQFTGECARFNRGNGWPDLSRRRARGTHSRGESGGGGLSLLRSPRRRSSSRSS